MSGIKYIGTGLVYTNPIPHVYSRHAAHPSVAVFPDGEMLVTAVIRQAFEAPDTRAYLFRSVDEGNTWINEGLLFPETGPAESDLGRLSVMPDGRLAAVYFRHNRSRKDQGYTNPENLGFVETEILLTRSYDKGRTWEKPWRIEPPLTGPAFESNSSLIFTADGRFLLPTATWRGWDGACPNGAKVVAFISHDDGMTWPEYMVMFDDDRDGLIYFENSLCELPDGRLICAAWGYDSINNIDHENQYVISEDGINFSQRRSTGIKGQTLALLALPDGRLLSVYRRMDKKGLWAMFSRLEGNVWINGSELPLWGIDREGLTHTGANMSENFAKLKFGAPRLILHNGIVFAVFWCYENCQGNIRWFKLKIE